MNSFRTRYAAVLGLLLLAPMWIGSPLDADDESVARDAVGIGDGIGVDAQTLAMPRDSAIRFLKSSQADDGSWTNSDALGITALVVRGLLDAGVPSDDPAVEKGLAHLLAHVQDDGGIYAEGSTHRNYETAITIMALKAADRGEEDEAVLASALVFLKGLQWDGDEEIDENDPAFGGSGYGRHQRPDLSNTQIFLEALVEAGVPKDDPAIQNALTFVSRCQNLESEFNQTEFAALIEDGGFYYTPAAGGTSQAGEEANGGLRSYASMTYAGLKSMIYAGVDKDDPRVTAATEWIQKHYSLDENPGLGQQGLFYYYHTFAKSLSALEVDFFEDADGGMHDWRRELAIHLIERQGDNGSWVNPTDRWYEGDPNLVTAYALMALRYCETPESADSN